MIFKKAFNEMEVEMKRLIALEDPLVGVEARKIPNLEFGPMPPKVTSLEVRSDD
ncbi:hypothetical protein KSP40_PGU005289 [Platanthera guangdongensis]|uniref:Uncharacterized protein n=1 Tax=Platanthera guangdongensis TaxID=2320717 RepID=A0ABR2MMQ1_9ASPA